MKKVILASVALLAALVAIYGATEWTGFGFDPAGPEMRRLDDTLGLAR